MKSGIIAAVAGLMGVFSSAFGTVWFLDARYASRVELQGLSTSFQDLSWSLLKDSIRDIRAKLRENPDDPDLIDELNETIDRLCRQYPEDRECHR